MSTPSHAAGGANGLDGFRALQELIAARHHVLLDRDDPIAMLHTLNELLVQQTATSLEQALTTALVSFGADLQNTTAGWKRETKALGERTLEAASRVSTQQIAAATQEFIAAVTRERERMATMVSVVRRAAALNLLVLIALLAVLGKSCLL